MLAAPGEAQPRVSVGQADAVVRAVFAAQDVARYDAAAQAYLGLVAGLDGPLEPEDRALVAQHLRQLAPVVPEPQRSDWGLGGAAASLPAGAGARIARWWRAQDDLPATPANERLHEHLARVAYALEAFAAPGDLRGYDDRGEVYVRLGPPDGAYAVEVSSSVAAFDLEVPRDWTRVPDNELWVYRSVRKGLHYLFVKPSARLPYREARAADLVPRPLQGASRGRGRLDALAVVMEEIYGQLAVRDPAYGVVFDAVSGVIAGGSVARGRPALVAQSLLVRARDEDTRIEGARQSLAPTAHSRTREGADPLDAALRWARLRQPDGSTRVVLHWGVPGATALRPSDRLAEQLRRDGLEVPDTAWVSVSLARLDAEGAVASVAHAHQRVGLAADGAVTRSVAAPLRAATDGLAVQWQGRLDAPGARPARPGRRVKVDTRRLPPLDPLPAAGFTVGDLQAYARQPGSLDLRPHPFAPLPEDGLVVAFEVYGLAQDPLGQARFQVEVAVAPRGESEQASASYDYVAGAPTSREQVEVDVSPYVGRAVDVIVRVTDSIAGVTEQRWLSFEAR